MHEKIKEIVALAIGVKPDALPDDAQMGNPGSWDSFAQLNIIIALEQEFSVSIALEDTDSLSSLAAIEPYLRKVGTPSP